MGDELGARAGARLGRDDRAADGLGSLARRGPCRHRRGHRGAGPELVPHRRLPLADPRRDGGRRSPGWRATRSTRGARAPCRGPDARRQRVTDDLAGELQGVDRLIVVGTGADRPAARELVLKVEEGAHVPAAMRDLETLLHGHLAGMDSRTGVVLILTESGCARCARQSRRRRAARGRRAGRPGRRDPRRAPSRPASRPPSRLRVASWCLLRRTCRRSSRRCSGRPCRSSC